MRVLALVAGLMATSAVAQSVPVPKPNPLRQAERAQPVQAQQAQRKTVCKDRAELIKVLAKKFNETQRSYGLQNDSRVLELYVSPDGSWTALLTLPSGRSCVVAAGEAWTILPPAPVGEPA